MIKVLSYAGLRRETPQGRGVQRSVGVGRSIHHKVKKGLTQRMGKQVELYELSLD